MMSQQLLTLYMSQQLVIHQKQLFVIQRKIIILTVIISCISKSVPNQRGCTQHLEDANKNLSNGNLLILR